MKTLVRSLPVCLLDPRIIALSADVVVWELPAQVRPISLGVADSSPSSINAPWPRLILAALRSGGAIELRVTAVKRKGRLLPGTPLFHAPLMNVTSAGLFGAQTEFSRIDPRLIEAYESVLLAQTYTAVSHGSTLRMPGVITRDSINSYQNMREWRSLAREGLVRFPGKLLSPRKQVLSQWLEELEGVIKSKNNVFELVQPEGGSGEKDAALP